MMAPLGKYEARKRGLEAPAAFAGVNAGSIDSRYGSPITAAAPLSHVLRDSDFLVTNICSHLTSLLRHGAHLKGYAPDNARDESRKPVVAARRIANGRAHGRHVVIVDAPAQSVSQHFFRQGLHEHIGMIH